MSDETSQPKTIAIAVPRKRRIIRRLIFFVPVGLFLFLLPVISETYFKCAICGMRHTEQRVTGAGFLVSSWERPTTCSDWYQAHIEPEHEHVWVRNSFARLNNVFGQTMLVQQLSSLASGPFSWLFLSEDRHLELYKNSPSPDQMRSVLLSLAHFEPYDSKAYQAQQETFKKLDEWIGSGMKSTWPFEKFP